RLAAGLRIWSWWIIHPTIRVAISPWNTAYSAHRDRTSSPTAALPYCIRSYLPTARPAYCGLPTCYCQPWHRGWLAASILADAGSTLALSSGWSKPTRWRKSHDLAYHHHLQPGRLNAV